MNDISPEYFQFQVRTEEESYNLDAVVMRVGSDWLVSIQGGEKPHIGAVAAAQSRPSLKGAEAVSETASVLCFPGHKEDVITKEVSEKLASLLEARVVVTAGIHWDDISPEGIQRVIENSRILISKIADKIRS